MGRVMRTVAGLSRDSAGQKGAAGRGGRAHQAVAGGCRGVGRGTLLSLGLFRRGAPSHREAAAGQGVGQGQRFSVGPSVAPRLPGRAERVGAGVKPSATIPPAHQRPGLY